MNRELAVIGLIGCCIAGAAALNYDWFPQNEPESITEVLEELQPEPVPDATVDEVAAFEARLNEKMITKVDQYSDSALLFLTVSDVWQGMTAIQKKEDAIALRNQWKQDCGCYAPILVFVTDGGVKLMKISAGQPELIK